MDNFKNQLWSHLDTCEIPFRRTCSQLVEEYGQRELVWSSTQSVCEMKTKPFIDHLVQPISFQFGTGSDLSAHTQDFACYIRQSDNTDVNFALAVDQLTELFGPGTEAGVSNTNAMRWRQGHASLTATVYPPDRNNYGGNDRHKRVPGSATECSIYITTGYLAPSRPEEILAMASFKSLNHPHGSKISFQRDMRSNRHLSIPHPVLENGFDEDMRYFFQRDRDRANVIPVDWIRSIQRHTLLPARGSGGEDLGFEVEWSKESKSTIYFLRHGSPHALKNLAKKLAERLGVPIVESESHDC